MTTSRQTEANRENAQHSTGPKTEAGKAASAQNARRHGLSATSIFIPPDREQDFKSTFACYYDEIKPIGEMQMSYFEQLVHAAWNLHIARELLVIALHQMDDKKISSANRYVAQYERSFSKAHKAIKDEQTDLALRAIPENEPIADLPLTCKIQVIAREATRLAATQERTQRQAHRTAILECVGRSFRPSNADTAVDANAELDRAA